MNFKLIICFLFSLNVFSQTDEITYYKANADVNFREGPSTKFEVLNIINIDDTIQLLETTNTSWSKIKYKGETGYSSLRFFEKLNLKSENENITLEPSSNLDDDISTGNWTPWFLAGGILSLITFLLGRYKKNRDTAILLSLFFGFMGLQKFYLGKYIQGVFSLLFFWTAIPFLIGLWDMISMTIKGNAEFKLKYRNHQSDNHTSSKKIKTNITSRNVKYKINSETEVSNASSKKYSSISNDNTTKKHNNKIAYSKLSNSSIELDKSETTNNRSDIKVSNEFLNTADKVIENYQSKLKDDSIIDIGEETFDLKIKDSNFEGNNHTPNKNQSENKNEELSGVPYWGKYYVYSYDEIDRANYAQKRFYKYFRDRLLNDEWTDIKGNTNYAFILYFELLELFEKNQDIILLEKQLKLLGECCSETRSYSYSSLLRILNKETNQYSKDKLEQLRDPSLKYELGFADYDPYSYRLGRIYKEKLNLSEKHEEWLNKFYNSSNVFNSIEGCCTTIINHFLHSLDSLDHYLISIGSSLEKEVDFLKGKMKKSDLTYGNVFAHNYMGERIQEEIYQTLYRRVENSVREKYHHKRKISVDFSITEKKLHLHFEERLGEALDEILNQAKDLIIEPNLNTQISLNAQNVNRWKIEFKEISSSLNSKGKNTFIKKIQKLEAANKKNPNVENILFEASKTIAKYDKIKALEYYAKYIDYDLNSDKIHNKKLTKTVQKSLFRDEEQLSEFKKIIQKLIDNKNLKATLTEIKEFYTPKRKKIILNPVDIEEAKNRHNKTINILSAYLEDDEEEGEVNNEEDQEVKMSFTSGTLYENSLFNEQLGLNKIHQELILKIAESAFSITQNSVEEIALKHGQLKNQLIDSVNELCSDFLEGEFLIEEDEEFYIMEESFYEELIKKY